MSPDISKAAEWIRSVTGTEKHWANLEEISQDTQATSHLKESIQRAYPSSFLSRRDFMEWMGGLAAVLGLSACTKQPQERIMAYTKQPEGLVPGKPLYYATAFPHPNGAAIGVLVESQMGRPTKIEGNPEHPSSLGATDAVTQASLLDMYDPDRLQLVSHRGAGQSYDDFFVALQGVLAGQSAKQGAGLRILTETVLSPTLGAQLRAVLAKYPKAKWVTYDPGRGEARRGAEVAFGEPVSVHYRFDKADVILSVDSDILGTQAGAVRYWRDLADRRRAARDGKSEAPRLYALITAPNPTSEASDHRWPLRPAMMLAALQEIARAVGVSVPQVTVPDDLREVVTAIANDLKAKGSRSLVVCGEYWPAEVHALCHAINGKLGALGSTVLVAGPVEENPTSESLAELVAEMESGAVDALAIFGGNPTYAAPGDVHFGAALAKVPFSFHYTSHANETTKQVLWSVPASHYLEAWSDARGHDGTVSLCQPLIAPLYGTRSAHEIVAGLVGQPGRSGYEILQEAYKTKLSGDFTKSWNRAIHDGVVANSAAAEKRVSPRAAPAVASLATDGPMVVLRPDPHVWDGRYANNGWLQELPKPTTKITWDNVVLLAPVTARKLQIGNGDRVRVAVNGATVEGPAWIQSGHAEDTYSLALGFGHTAFGRLGTGAGFAVAPVQTQASRWLASGAKLEKGAGRIVVACTQDHQKLEGRELVRAGTYAKYQSEPDSFRAHEHIGSLHGAMLKPKSHGAEHGHGEEHGHAAPGSDGHASNIRTDGSNPAVLPKQTGKTFEDANYAWGMAIDLSLCNSCNACVAACQSENNIAVVGKDQVANGRELHWLRIDRYESADEANPEVDYQPMLCQHCETAPCTVVCPVNATSISPEGINEMTYNRCIGTKYCSNNCPYKVRRFNFFQYSDVDTPVIQLMRNPEVTVRARGVMEKCTFCVQRVNSARIEAKKEDRLIRDGEVTPACAAACPSQAITFGNLKDKESRVSKQKATALNYSVLEELATRPRTTYLAKLRNPNPAIGSGLARKSW